MAKIQNYFGGNVQARGLANVSQGVHATPDSQGGAFARDMGNLGGAVGRFGLAWAHLEEIKQERIQRTEVRNDMTAADNDYREWEKTQLQTRRGLAAANLDRDADAWWEERRKQLEEKYRSQGQRDLFARQYEGKRGSAVDAMSRFSFREVENGERLSREKQNESFLFDSEVRGLANDARVGENRALMHANIRANLRGQSEDVVAAAIRDSDRALFSRMVKAHASRSPANALDYLERDDVKAVFTPAELEGMRQQFNQADATAAAWQHAVNDAKAGVTPEEILERAIALFPDDPGAAKLYASIADNYRSRQHDATAAKAVEATAKAWTAFAQSGFAIESLPVELRNGDPKLYREMVNYAEWHNKPENKKIDPDYHWVWQMEQRDPSELRSWLNEPAGKGEESNFEMLLRKTAGNMPQLNKILERSLKEDRAVSGNSGAASRTAKFNPSEFFENAYGDAYKNEGGWWGEPTPGNYYDDETNTAKSRRNGFLQFYYADLEEKERVLGRAATAEEQREVAFELMRRVRERPDMLDSSFYSQRAGNDAGPQEAQSIKAGRETLTATEKYWNQGEESVVTTLVPGAAPVKFGSIEPGDTRRLGPDIVDMKAKAVYRAYYPGKLGSVSYEPGDMIAQGKMGEWIVFGADSRQKGAPVIHIPPVDAAEDKTEQALAKQREEEVAIRQEINQLENRKRELEKEAGGNRSNMALVIAESLIATKKAKITNPAKESKFYVSGQ